MTNRMKTLKETAEFISKNPRAGQIIGLILTSFGVCAVIAGGGIVWVSTDILHDS